MIRLIFYVKNLKIFASASSSQGFAFAPAALVGNTSSDPRLRLYLL